MKPVPPSTRMSRRAAPACAMADCAARAQASNGVPAATAAAVAPVFTKSRRERGPMRRICRILPRRVVWNQFSRLRVRWAHSEEPKKRGGPCRCDRSAGDDRRPPFAVLRRLLESVRHAQHAPLVPVSADELQPDRSPGARKPCRQRDRRIRHERHVPARPHPVDVGRASACHRSTSGTACSHRMARPASLATRSSRSVGRSACCRRTFAPAAPSHARHPRRSAARLPRSPT